MSNAVVISAILLALVQRPKTDDKGRVVVDPKTEEPVMRQVSAKEAEHARSARQAGKGRQAGRQVTRNTRGWR